MAIALSALMLFTGDVCAAKESAVSSSESLSTNVAATKMIKTVGRKMVTALESYIREHGMDDAMSGLEWEFMLLDTDEVNAFCAPDGKIAFLEGICRYRYQAFGLHTHSGFNAGFFCFIDACFATLSRA